MPLAQSSPDTPANDTRAARPFVKWVGGKRRVVPELFKHIPATIGSYHEPFLGGGALFFALTNAGRIDGLTHLTDNNHRLIRTYNGIRTQVDSVIERLRSHAELHDETHYYAVRAQNIDAETDDATVAAWFIYLNKTGFNGLYRVNKKGGFNVPIGRYTNPNICDTDNLKTCALALQPATLSHEAFDTVLGRAQRGDVVYFDPPYVPVSQSANFTSYTRDGFTLDDQRHLRDVALELKRSGVDVILSNSDTPQVRELYSADFQLRRILVGRAINSAADRRGAVPEVIIW